MSEGQSTLVDSRSSEKSSKKNGPQSGKCEHKGSGENTAN